MAKRRFVLAQVESEVGEAVTSHYYKKMSLLDSINHLASNKNYGDNSEYIDELERRKLEEYAAFDMAFRAMCRKAIPGVSTDGVQLDFDTFELFIEPNVPGEQEKGEDDGEV